MRNHHRIKKVRDYFLNNPNKTLQEIADDLNECKSVVSEILSITDYFILPILNEENTFFLFSELFEKKILTDPYKIIKNGYDFSEKEKTFLRGYGFKFH